jgi:type II secretory pathway predicted ATPase ExeA
MPTPKKQTTAVSASRFFSYRYPPFADTFEIAKPFESPHETLLAHRAAALIAQGKSFALYGEAGSGKSMLVKTIIANLDAKQYRCALLPYGGMKPSLMLRELCEALDIDATGRKSLLGRLQKNFLRSTDKPFPVIVVDDAHTMENTSFIDLCSLLHDAHTRTAAATLVLVGQPVLKRRLELDIFAPVRTRLTCCFKQHPLNSDEAVEFLRYRLEIAQADANIFEQEALECIAVDTKGNRRLMMNLAAMCMEEAARRNDKIITAELVTSVNTEIML